MASDLDSSPRTRERADSPSSSGVRESLRSFARDGARVVVRSGDTNRQRFVVHPGAPAQRFRIGSSSECNWTLEADGVAALHLELHWDGGELFVTPLGGSTVLLNGATHRHRARITGDTIMQVGAAQLAFYVGADPRPEEQTSPSRPPQAFHVARPPRIIDDSSRTRTAMGMASPLFAALQAKSEAARPLREQAGESARPGRRTEPFFVGALGVLDDAGRVPRPPLTAPVTSVGEPAGGPRDPSATEREPWPEPPLADHERDGAHFLSSAEPASQDRANAPEGPELVELALPGPQAAAPAPLLEAPRGSPERSTPVPPWEEEAHPAASPRPRPSRRAQALPPPTASLPLVRAVRVPEDTRGTTLPAMRVLTSELTVVDPGAHALPLPSAPVGTPRPAPREPSVAPALAERPSPQLQGGVSTATPPERANSPSRAMVAELGPTQSVPIDTAWPLPPAAPVPAPPLQPPAQARWVEPLPAPQPGRPLLATSAALRERYPRDREAEWETPSAAMLERPRVSVLGHPKPAQVGHGRVYWFGIALALVGMAAAPLAVPELRDDGRELVRKGLRALSGWMGNEGRGLDLLLPPRPPRAPEIGERVR